MNTKLTQPQVYTMPLKQLLKLLETTADDEANESRRPRSRAGRKALARRLEVAEAETR